MVLKHLQVARSKRTPFRTQAEDSVTFIQLLTGLLYHILTFLLLSVFRLQQKVFYVTQGDVEV